MKYKEGLQKNATIFSVMISLGVALIVCVLGVLVGAFMISREYVPEAGVDIIAMTIVFASSFSGAMLCRKSLQSERLLGIFIYAGAYLAVLSIGSFAAFGGHMEGALHTILACIVGCVPCCIENKNKFHFKHNKFRYRK